MHRSSTPIVRFHRLIEQARLPQRADRSAAGTLPTRAYRYCQAVTTAASYGWWVFPPTDLQFLWDGHDIFWQCTGWQDWLPLMPAAQFPDFSACFDAAAPGSLAGCSPPFLTAIPEPGTLQIWTGLIARTAPDWSLLIRAPANLPAPGGYALYEGIVETDHWFGPLFTNLPFTRTNCRCGCGQIFRWPRSSRCHALPMPTRRSAPSTRQPIWRDSQRPIGPTTRRQSQSPMTIRIVNLADMRLPRASVRGTVVRLCPRAIEERGSY